MMAACPTVPRPSPASALAPAMSTTPPNPITTPNNRPTVSDSCRVQSKLIRYTKSGVVEFRMAARALSTDCWPNAMSVYGIAQATQPWMNSPPTKFPRRLDFAPSEEHEIQSSVAATATRAATNVMGRMVVSAILVSA